ncbi:MAG TPA: AarF/UbiB family protein [Pyrinomonadaceae bacterium]|nr:AarF/UbiB family protein [Pyrinomonadaceae bacterium]
MSTLILRRGRIRSPRQFREFLERLGPTFIKIGQYLSQRPDILPQEYCDELIKLLDRVPPFPWEVARDILTRELGGPPDQVFAFINFRSVAAGSLAQVHLARLHDGTEVAVKIQRPDIRERVMRDLKRVRLISRILEMSGANLVVSPHEVMDELTEWMMQEIDFKHELANVRRLERLVGNSSFQRVPHPFPNYCTGKVLTTEYLRGVPVSEILVAMRSGHAEQAKLTFLQGVDIDRFAANLITATLTQVLRYQFFHADLHPGNLLALPDNVVGYVDFGLCDELDERVRDNQIEIISAVYSGEMDAIFNALTEILVPGQTTDMESFRRDFVHETRSLESGGRARTGGNGNNTERDADRSPIANYLVGLMRAARRNHLQVPARVLSMYRALLTAETVAFQLGTSDGIRRIGRSFFRTLQRERVVDELSDPSNFEPTLLSLLNLKRDAPRHLNQILTELADGSLSLRVRASESPRDSVSRDRRARLVSVSILSVSVSLLLTIPGLPSFYGYSLAWPLTAILVLLYVWILIRLRRM